jgi:hypothetical protein
MPHRRGVEAMKHLAVLAAVLLLAACGERPPLEPALKVVRTYGWESAVTDPAPAWHPSTYRLVARTKGGFLVLEEGRKTGTYASEERRETYFPEWLNADQFIFGPGRNVTRMADGSVVPPSDGLTVVTLDAKGQNPQRRQLCDRGFRPRPGPDATVFAQWGQRILRVERDGAHAVFCDGFDPLPQRDGPGLCFRETPVFEPDYWTGKPALGRMFVRWDEGRVDALPGAVQAEWTRRGGVLATVVDAAPAGPEWWTAGTRVVHLAGPGAAPVELARNVRDPAANPAYDLWAWTAEDGALWVGVLRPGVPAMRIADRGGRPRWSHDGLRLVCEEPPLPGRQTPYLRVYVLALQQP